MARRSFQNGGLASLVQPQRGAGRGTLGYGPPYGGYDTGVGSSSWPVGGAMPGDMSGPMSPAGDVGGFDFGARFQAGGPVRGGRGARSGRRSNEIMSPSRFRRAGRATQRALDRGDWGRDRQSVYGDLSARERPAFSRQLLEESALARNEEYLASLPPGHPVAEPRDVFPIRDPSVYQFLQDSGAVLPEGRRLGPRQIRANALENLRGIGEVNVGSGSQAPAGPQMQPFGGGAGPTPPTDMDPAGGGGMQARGGRMRPGPRLGGRRGNRGRATRGGNLRHETQSPYPGPYYPNPRFPLPEPGGVTFQAGGVVEEPMMPEMGGMPNAMQQGPPPMGGGLGSMNALAMDMMQGGPPPTDPGLGGMPNSMQQGPPPMGPEGQLADEELIEIYTEAKAALEGSHPNPEEAIARFVEAFGPEALEALKASIGGGMDDGISDGMSDSIPGNIDGIEEVSLSEGEYVVPADVVSGIGNGDTNSGADRLQGMIEQIRTARTGAPGMPEQINFEEMVGQV